MVYPTTEEDQIREAVDQMREASGRIFKVLAVVGTIMLALFLRKR